MKIVSGVIVGIDVAIAIYAGVSGDHVVSSVFAGLAISIYLVSFKP